jgi:hypothetical protein
MAQQPNARVLEHRAVAVQVCRHRREIVAPEIPVCLAVLVGFAHAVRRLNKKKPPKTQPKKGRKKKFENPKLNTNTNKHTKKNRQYARGFECREDRAEQRSRQRRNTVAREIKDAQRRRELVEKARRQRRNQVPRKNKSVERKIAPSRVDFGDGVVGKLQAAQRRAERLQHSRRQASQRHIAQCTGWSCGCVGLAP